MAASSHNPNAQYRHLPAHLAAAWLLTALVTTATAQVDLVTIPVREGVQLTIYNSEDITLVREHRFLTVKRGINRIQFDWSNTLIDPTSIDCRILDHTDQVDLIDTTFPADRGNALQWNIESQLAGKVPVEIRYFTSGITWTADYIGVANQDETRLDLVGYVRVDNQSGELYDQAQVRLVVGTINLVEKIADLARRGLQLLLGDMDFADKLDTETRQKKLPQRQLNEWARSGLFRADGAAAKDLPKDIIKQGLSEYFLFTIDGREDIQNNEPKRLVALKASSIPLECIYKLTDREQGDHFTKFYRFKNEKLKDEQGQEKKLPAMENLGLAPLPDGSVRLFSRYANQDLAYLGATSTKYVPVGDRLEVNLGPEPEISIVRRLKDQQITNVVARQYKRRLDDEFVLYYDLIDYDETFYYEEELVSGKKVDARVELERRFQANVVLWADDEAPSGWNSQALGAYVDLHEIPGRKERVDANHAKYFLTLKPGQRQQVRYAVTYKRRQVGPELNAQRKREPL